MDAAHRVWGVGDDAHDESNGDVHGVDNGKCEDEGDSDGEELIKIQRVEVPQYISYI